MERLGWERRHWAKFRDFTKSEAEKIASFDKSLWKDVAKCDMKTYMDVPDAVMETAHENVDNWLIEKQGLKPIANDIFEWRMKQALYYELNKHREATTAAVVTASTAVTAPTVVTASTAVTAPTVVTAPTAVTDAPAPDSQASKYYDPVRESAGLSRT
ncbi:hypothetical protein MPH_13912 [Macrophomina phaseolina MS6]|uniref:Uncharacterized protein n=1 Tax=Macrophomina phaseolina (strain MS6) TaxID=1126212 RepID=K2R4J2_MACPH|nr:hypothetical protein MPH_13912 [Macrophomina phaseolina MS6]